MNTYYVQALSWDRLGQLLAYKTSHLGAREGDGEVNALVQGMAGGRTVTGTQPQYRHP